MSSTVISPTSIESLPTRRLLAFTTAGFLAIIIETMPAGLLPKIGHGLGVSEAMAGQLVTLYRPATHSLSSPASPRGWRRA
ncbi:hypothetical protein [Nocardia sp. NPDC052566]|uniref:hypothetical protein n=1 Tax=Nocardia sp. NPDC052566 TaxID=3364330 RepID=UPI0037C59460